MDMTTCLVTDCTAPPHGRGYCRRHYDALRNHGHLEVREPIRVCTLDGCDRPHVARGWCALHHQRWQRHGDPEWTPEPTPTPQRTCSVEGCSRPHHSRGLCNACYNRTRRAERNTTGSTTGAEPRLPVEPLLEALEARGGIYEAMSLAGIHNTGKGRGKARDSLVKVVDRARQRGYLPVSSADRVAIEVLRTHPCFIWGEIWWGEPNADGVLEPVAEPVEELIAA